MGVSEVGECWDIERIGKESEADLLDVESGVVAELLLCIDLDIWSCCCCCCC